jgi:hypothetical protein
MSSVCRSVCGPRAAVAAVFAALIATAALPVGAVAQGGAMGPPGMGGHGGRGEFGKQPNAPAPNVSKHFEEMASLKEVLKHVDGLNKDQKDAFGEIERGYTKSFKPLGQEAQQVVDSAHAAHDRPDPERMDSLRKAAKQLRDDELTATRQILTTDPQRNQFDQNVAQIQQEEAKREEEMQQQMSSGAPSGGHGGVAH